MSEIHMVVCRNYRDGVYSTAFSKLEDAVKRVAEDIDNVVKQLAEEGYDPIVTEIDESNISLNVNDSDIYFDWMIITTEIE